MSMTFHHIGIATIDIEKSIFIYQEIGYEWQKEMIYTDVIQNVRLAFMFREGHPLIELVASLNAASPINNLLHKSKTSPYHTCYEVEDIEATIKSLKALRFFPTAKPVPAIAFDNRLICFLYHPHFGLVELLQR